MVEVFADDILSVPVVVSHEDQVAARTHADLVRDVIGQEELTVAPLDISLLTRSATVQERRLQLNSTHPLVPDVQVVTTDVVVELLGIGRLDKGHRSRALVAAEEDVKEHSAPHGIRNIGMSRSIREVGELDCAGALALILRTLVLSLQVVGPGRPVNRRLGLARGVLVLLVLVCITGSPGGVFVVPTAGAIVRRCLVLTVGGRGGPRGRCVQAGATILVAVGRRERGRLAVSGLDCCIILAEQLPSVNGCRTR